jgi:putative ABC transport system permease protein
MSFLYVFRELTVRRHRTILNCLGIALAVALVVTLNLLSEAYKKAIRKPFEVSGIDVVLHLPKINSTNSAQTKKGNVVWPDSATPISADEVIKIQEVDGIESLATSMQVWSFDSGKFKIIEGVDPEKTDLGPAIFSKWVKTGRFFSKNETGVVVAEKHFAKFYRLKVGDEVAIAGKKFKLIGTVEIQEDSQLSAPNFFMPIGEVQRLAGVGLGFVNAIYLHLNKAASAGSVIDHIRKLNPGLDVSSPDSSLSAGDSIFGLLQKFTLAISIVIIATAAFLIFKTVSTNLFQRIHEVGVMKAVGWTNGDIRNQLMLEIAIQSIIGSVVGLIAGYSVSYGLSSFSITAPLPWSGGLNLDVAGKGVGIVDFVYLRINVSLSFVLIIVFGALLVTLISSFMANRQTKFVKPAELLRNI